MVRDFFKREGVSLYGASLAPLSKTEEMKLAKLAANGEMGESKLSILPDTVSYTPEETAIYHLQKQYLYKNLEKLDILEKQIICMLYGLKLYKRPYSLAEIGKVLGESKQYIHYIKQRGP